MSKEKLSKRMWFNICLFSFIGGVAWNVENMYFNTFLYNSVYAGASQNAMAGTMAPTTAISRMVALSAVAAVLTTFVMGTLSDKMKNRKLFISVGYIVWGVVTGLFGFITKENISALLGITDEVKVLAATVWTVIIMDIVMTFMGSTSNDAAFNAWVTDVTTPKTRPGVETALTFVTFAAMGAVMGVGSFAQTGAISYQAFFIGLGVIVTLCGIIGLFTLKNPQIKESEAVSSSSSSYWADLFYGFRPSVIYKNSRLYLTLLAVGCFNVAFQVFFPYLLVYLQYVIIPDNGGGEFLTVPVIIVAVAVVLILVLGIVLLLKAANKSKGVSLCGGVASLALGLFILSTTTNIYGVLIGIAPTFIGYVVLSIQFNAAIKDFIPAGKAGLFQGIRMIFMVLIPMVVGPAIGDIACRNSAVTYINEYAVETIIPSKSMFLYAGFVALTVFIPLFFVLKKGFKVEEE